MLGCCLLYFIGTGETGIACLIILCLIYGAITAAGSAKIGLNYFLKSQLTIHDNDEVLLTFDDGPDEKYTPVVLDVLNKEGIKAVFFLIGKNAEQHPGLVRRIIAEGHVIGNHSYSHAGQLPFFSRKNFQHEIIHCSEVFRNITGLRPRLFRPPFGVTTPRYAKVLSRMDMVSVGWSLRTMDTVMKEASQLAEKVGNSVKGGDIILLHDTRSVTAEALPEIIRQIKGKRLNFASPHLCFEVLYEES